MDTVEIFSSLLHEQPSSFSLYLRLTPQLTQGLQGRLYSLGKRSTHATQLASYLLAQVRFGVLILSNVSRLLVRKICAPSSTAVPAPAAPCRRRHTIDRQTLDQNAATHRGPA